METEVYVQEGNSLHSEEMDELIGSAPGRIIRYGIVVFIVIIGLCLAVSFSVDYPEVVQASCTIYTDLTPRPVTARVGGRLSTLLVKDGEKVEINQPLALINTSVGYEDLIRMSDMTQFVWACIQNNQWEKIYVPEIKSGINSDLKSSYRAFYALYTQAYPFIHKIYSEARMEIFRKDLIMNDSLTHLLLNQKVMYEKDYSLAENDYQLKQLLCEEKGITPAQLKQEESKLLFKKISLEDLKISVMKNVANSMEKKKEMMDFEKENFAIRTAFIQSLNKLVNDIQDWKQKYVLYAPVDGVVSLGEANNPYKEIQPDIPIFYVEPQTEKCFAEIRVNQANFGKIAISQLVIIHLPSYPSQEYGSLEARVAGISSTPNKDRQYTVKVNLNRIMNTNTGNRINLVNGLDGDAEIITRKTKLFYKFFHSVQSLFQKNTRSQIRLGEPLKESSKT